MKKLILPQVINVFNVYRDGDRQIGIAAEVTLPEIAYKTVTIEGAGVPGSYDEAVIGNFDSIKQTIPFNNLDTSLIDFSNPMEVQNITMRASQQITDRTTGQTTYRGIRVVEKGKCVSFNPGKIKQADKMDATVTIECMYLLIEVDGQKLTEIDKWNGIYIVNGKDLMEKARKYC